MQNSDDEDETEKLRGAISYKLRNGIWNGEKHEPKTRVGQNLCTHKDKVFVKIYALTLSIVRERNIVVKNVGLYMYAFMLF